MGLGCIYYWNPTVWSIMDYHWMGMEHLVGNSYVHRGTAEEGQNGGEDASC